MMGHLQRHSRILRTAFWYGVLLMSLLMVSCGRNHTREEFVGSWESADGATVELRVDGFSAAGIPQRVLRLHDPGQPLVCSGDGKWEVKGSTIVLYWMHISPSDCFGADLYVEDGKQPRLYFLVGDLDNDDRYEFTRRTP